MKYHFTLTWSLICMQERVDLLLMPGSFPHREIKGGHLCKILICQHLQSPNSSIYFCKTRPRVSSECELRKSQNRKIAGGKILVTSLSNLQRWMCWNQHTKYSMNKLAQHLPKCMQKNLQLLLPSCFDIHSLRWDGSMSSSHPYQCNLVQPSGWEWSKKSQGSCAKHLLECRGWELGKLLLIGSHPSLTRSQTTEQFMCEEVRIFKYV